MAPIVYASKLKAVFNEAYDRARSISATSQRRQKDLYDCRVHGKQFAVGDMVWLHSALVPRGKSRKLHHPWTGPWQVVKKLSDAVYRLQGTTGRRRRVIVHFDRLKPYVPGTRLEASDHPSSPIPLVAQPTVSPSFTPVIVDDDDLGDAPSLTPVPSPPEPRRYPTRHRRAPERYNGYLSW